MATRRREDTDMDHYLHRRFDEIGVPRQNTRRNAATARTSPKRGDVWISRVAHTDAAFEERIVALVECKDRQTSLDDADWRVAVADGQVKARLQGLKTFFVTNTDGITRLYNTETLQLIEIDGREVSDFLPISVLMAVQAQVNRLNSSVHVRSFSRTVPDASRFRTILWNIRQIYRSRSIGRNSETAMIKTALTFCILKLLSERQKVSPILPATVDLWEDWRHSHLDRDINNTISDIIGSPGFAHLAGCLELDSRLDAAACEKIKNELTPIKLFGSDFDFFGLIYETYASRSIKKDFGEFYTPRHIVQFMVRLLLRNESTPRNLSICDPACGTGGFLVESFVFLQETYRQGGSLSAAVERRLKEATFVGLDTNEEYAIPYARTNMVMAGDGGAYIRPTEDSLSESLDNQFDYVIANVPYGLYSGQTDISLFAYTNSRRYELLFLEKIVRMLKPGGSAAVIVPDGLVQNTSGSVFRQRFLMDARVDAVVSLPSFSFLPYTGEKTYILFFEKKKEAARGVIQASPIWHYIVDSDGFQAGSKRFPINDDDITSLTTEDFLNLQKPGFAESISADLLSAEHFFSLSSEYFLRREEATEVSLETFLSVVEIGEAAIDRISK